MPNGLIIDQPSYIHEIHHGSVVAVIVVIHGSVALFTMIRILVRVAIWNILQVLHVLSKMKQNHKWDRIIIPPPLPQTKFLSMWFG